MDCYKYFQIIMTWKQILTLSIVCLMATSKAPFVELNTVHEAFSEFEVNLIFNENRNHPIILTTVSVDKAKEAARTVLQGALKGEPYGGFAILVDCRKFQWNLNHTLGLCQNYKAGQPIDEGSDPNFHCQFLNPAEMKIRVKGHTLMKNHAQEYLGDGTHFNGEYLAEVIKKNIPDFVTYVEDEYDLKEFLQYASEFKASKKPKLIYFDQNLLAPLFLKKLASMMDGRMDVGVTDDSIISKKYSANYDDIVLLQYNYHTNQYESRVITVDIESPIDSVLGDSTIKHYLSIKKNRDILLDFEHSSNPINNFDSLNQIYNLQSHGRIIILQVSSTASNYTCDDLSPISEKYETLFNYVCFSREKWNLLTTQKTIDQVDKVFLFIVDSVENSSWVERKKQTILKSLPQAISRQRVSTETEAEHCIRTAFNTERDPIFFYFSEKAGEERTSIINYLNSLPEVTSLQYICQVYLPDDALIKRFSIKQDTIFTMYDPDRSGSMKKLQHTKISNFIQIKMFLREISIQKMLKVYEEKLIRNQIKEIRNSEDLTQQCFNKKCIVGLIATGRYRESEQIQILKQLKLFFEDQFKFVWIDGICHWDIPRQLKILKKKEKVIDRSHVFYYNEKDTSFSLWGGKKFWDRKDLKRWVKSLRNSRSLGSLKFALDIQDRICKPKEAAKTKGNEEL